MKIGAAIVIEDQKILICQRAQTGSCANLWEFPGGKLEPLETLEECTVRECEEELGIHLEIQKQVAVSTYHYPDRDVEITFFLAKRIGGTLTMRVHQDIRWVTPVELLQYSFCPADEELVNQLSNGFHF